MALVIKDRVKETTTTTGTGAYTLAGAEDGYQAFSVIGDGNTTYYACTDDTEWEVGVGTYTASGTSLARTTILASSNSDAAVNWGSGEKFIFVTQPASKAVYNDASGDFVGSPTFTNTVTFEAINHPTHAEGQVYYDTNHKTLSYQGDISGVEHEIGIEEHVRVYNNSGSTIAKGKPVYWSGNANDYPTIGLANATSETKYNVQGLTAHSIANNSYGYVIVSGLVDEIDTSGLTAGQNVFAGLTDGALQNASPTYPNFPMCLGWVIKSHATEGIILINQQNHSVNSFRVRTDAHVGGDLIIGGDLTVQGSQIVSSTENIAIGGAFNYLNAGNTIGEANTTFSGTGVDDAYFSGHYNGPDSRTFYVKIDGAKTGTNGVDTITWSYNSDFSSPEGTAVDISVGETTLAYGIGITFATDKNHTLNDQWSGSAAPVNVDTGFFTNYNTGSSGVGYTHAGMYWDASTAKWTLLDEYDPEPEGTIDLTDASVVYGTLKAGTFEGDLSGDVTGNADTATNLATARNISLTGDVSGSASFDGSTNVSITATVANDSHTHDTQYVKLDGSSTMTGTLDVPTVDLGDWTITELGGNLIFQYQGTTKFSMDSSGTMKVANDVETDATF